MRVSVFLCISIAAAAQQGPPPRPAKISDKYREALRAIDQIRKSKPPSTSVGTPTDAKLLNAAEMPRKGYGYKLLTERAFGTDEMVFGLIECAATLADKWGDDDPISIGDISAKDGGKLSPHINHQAGRDVDLGFFICDDKGRAQGNRLLRFDKEGKSKEGTLRFDVARNWEYVCAMMANPHFGGEIKFVLIAEWLRELLLKPGESLAAKARTAEERSFRERQVKEAEKILRVKNDHDNHFHLSIKVTREDNKEGGRD